MASDVEELLVLSCVAALDVDESLTVVSEVVMLSCTVVLLVVEELLVAPLS